MHFLSYFLVAFLPLLSIANAACARGLAWGANWDYAPRIGRLPMISWYHSWGVGPVTSMPVKNEFVPMFWGPAKWWQWNRIKQHFEDRPAPKHLFSFNEPDLSSQSNMNPYYAAALFMDEIYPWRAKGTKVGSPAIIYNLKWMKTFLAALDERGGDIDFLCLHWYGSYKDMDGFQNYINAASKLAPGKPIWMLEIGVTIASNPTQRQVKDFMMNAYAWMDTQPKIQRASWYGGFEPSTRAETFASRKNALIKNGGAPSDLGQWYGWTALPDRKRSTQASNRRDVNYNASIVAVHCDELCELRNEQIKELAGLDSAAK